MCTPCQLQTRNYFYANFKGKINMLFYTSLGWSVSRKTLPLGLECTSLGLELITCMSKGFLNYKD